MNYWESVLNEVLNRKNQQHGFLFTEQGQLLDIDQVIQKNEDENFGQGGRITRTYFLGDEYPGVYFTYREAQCAYWISQHFTIAETAQCMTLSARTVEYYVNRMKEKMCCVSKKRLVEKIIKTDLLEQLKADGFLVVKH